MTRPLPMGDPRTHFWLVVGMAETCGADLPAAFHEGQLDSGEWASMVTDSRTCSKPCACQTFLDSHVTADEPPDYCVNRDRLTELSERS